MAAPADLVDLGHNRGQARLQMAQSVWRLDAKLGRPLDVNRAYADYASQMRYYLDWTAFKANPTAWRRANPGRSDPPLALHPDQSWHCKGMAIDTDDRLGQSFLDAGFRFVVPSEPWHGQYYANLDKFFGQPSSGGSTPFPIPTPIDQEEIDMPNGYYAKGDKSSSVFWIDQDTGKRRGVTQGELTAAQSFNQATGGKTGAGYVAVIPQAMLDAIPAS